MPTIAEAARRLGVSNDTVRRRIRAGELAATLANGRYDVKLPEEASTEATRPDGLHWEKLVETLEGQIEDLRHQLATREREIGELHQLLGQKALSEGDAETAWWKFWK